MSSGRDAFGRLVPIQGPALKTSRCTHGASLFSAGCGEPAIVVYEGWSSQTTEMPPYQPRCEEHLIPGAIVVSGEIPPTMRGHYQS